MDEIKKYLEKWLDTLERCKDCGGLYYNHCYGFHVNDKYHKKLIYLLTPCSIFY